MRSPRDARLAASRRKSLSNRGRVTVAVLLAALAVLVLSLRGLARFYTDYLWFDSLSLTSVWSGLLASKVALGVVFTLAFFALLLVNLIVADRLAPRFRPSGPEEELLERYFEVVGKRGGSVRVGVALLFAVITGGGVSQQWNNWLLFVNGGSFGSNDPLFGRDIGFYVFKLPFLSFVVNWLFTAFVIILIVTAVAHYLNGGIRVQTPAQRVTAQVKAHLSLLLAVLALIKAANYWLSRFELTASSRGFVNGASYTDVKAQLPAINLLLLISLFSTVLFIYNIRRRGWVLPASAVGLWAFLAVLAGQAYPWFVQRFQVEPVESTREQPYIERNVAATRIAYGLDSVTVRTFTGKGEIGPVELASAAGQSTLAAARLLDPEIIGEAFQKNQQDLSWVKIDPILDVDRYEIDGKTTPVVVAARQLASSNLPTKSWEAERLIYTHGYGMVIAPANEAVNKEPDYVVQNTPIQVDKDRLKIDMDPKRARLYFTEEQPSYAFVNTGRTETGFRDDQFRYDGAGGVRLDSALRRIAFALRFWNINPVISSYINDQTEAQYVRGVAERVAKVAPFLSLDSDPYPVMTSNGIVYVLDAYTTTDRYPYSESKDALQGKFAQADLPKSSGLNHNFNYVRNSVKAVVDSYDGTVRLYVVEQPSGQVDPIIEAYRKAFPKLFTSASEMPAELAAHLRHPEDLFRVQTTAYGPYRVDAPNFYGPTQRWVVSQQPATNTARTTATTQPAAIQPGNGPADSKPASRSNEKRMVPQYLQLQPPGETKPDFVLMRSFVPVSENDEQRKLTGFMIAKPNGALVAYEVPRAELAGPTLISANIDANAEVSQKVSLLDQRGSKVKFGNLLLLPIGDGVLWIRPLYVTAEGSNSVPNLEAVVVVYKERVVQAASLDEALGILFGKAATPNGRGVDDVPPITPTTTPGGTSGGPVAVGPDAVAEWAKQAEAALAQAEALLRGGDLGGYKAKVDEAKQLIEKVAKATTPTTIQQGGKA